MVLTSISLSFIGWDTCKKIIKTTPISKPPIVCKKYSARRFASLMDDPLYYVEHAGMCCIPITGDLLHRCEILKPTWLSITWNRNSCLKMRIMRCCEVCNTVEKSRSLCQVQLLLHELFECIHHIFVRK
jgi:hypothetical protein